METTIVEMEDRKWQIAGSHGEVRIVSWFSIINTHFPQDFSDFAEDSDVAEGSYGRLVVDPFIVNFIEDA